MKRDITNAGDLKLLLDEFYKAAADEAEFEDHFKDVDLKAHITRVTGYWERVLFGKPHSVDAVQVHKDLDERSPLTPEHFRRWVQLFRRTVDEHFEGPTANNAKFRAEIIATGIDQQISGT